MRDPKWAIRASCAVGLSTVLSSVHCVVVAGLAEVVPAFSAHEKSHRAAVHALEVDEFVAMLLAHAAAKA